MARKRANGEGTIRKRKNGTWEARVTVGFDPETGKQKYKCVYGRTQNDVRKKLDEIVQDNDQRLVAEQGQTVGEWLDSWINDFLSDVKDGTVVSYKSLCRLISNQLSVILSLQSSRLKLYKNSITAYARRALVRSISRIYTDVSIGRSM